MKKLFYLLLLFISVNARSQVFIGADGAIHPSGSYFAGKQGEFQTGLFLLTRITERDSIPMWQRTFGMLVYVRNTDSIYALKSPTLDNSNWSVFKQGSNVDLSTLVKYIDTTLMLANRLKISDTATMLANRLKVSDTATMLAGYGKSVENVKYSDTASILSNRLRISDTATMLAGYGKSVDNMKYSDTASMLSNRLKISDTATMLAGYGKSVDNVKYSDTASMLSNRLKISDTATMLAGYGKSADNVKYTDTASLLSNRLKISDTTTMLAGYAKASDNLNNVKYSDTASMLSNRLKISDTATMLAGYGKSVDNMKYSDTASMLSNRLKISDTATMLAGYGKSVDNVKYSDTASMLSNRLKISDTATMLAGYGKSADNVKYTDTASLLSNRLKISDTTTMLAGYAKASDNLNNVKYSDTALMLSNRLKISDTATMLAGYGKSVDNVKYSDTASMLFNRLKVSDTTTMLTGYAKSGSVVKYTDTSALVFNRLKISDTAAMLSNRLRITDTASMLSGYATNTSVVKYTDTADMLLNRLKISDTATMLNSRLNIADTSAMLSGYQRIGGGSGSTESVVKYTDTAAMLSGYMKTTDVFQNGDTTTMLAPYAKKADVVNNTDTALLLGNYARKYEIVRPSDTTAMLSNYAKTDHVTKYADTSAMLSNLLRISDTASMLSNRMSFSDTADMLANRLLISDTATMLSGYIRNEAMRKDSAWLRVGSIYPAVNNQDSMYTMGKVAIGTSDPAVSAILDLTSTSKGFLMPRMTAAERDAIVNPVAGLQIYNTTTGLINFYNGTNWSISSIRDTVVYTVDDSIGLVTPSSVNIKAGAIQVGSGQLLATAPTLTFSSNIRTGQEGWTGDTRFAYDNNGFLISHNGAAGQGSSPKGFGLGTGGRSSDIFISDSGRVGIGLPLGSLPVAKLHNTGSTLFGTKLHNDVPGGVIGTAANTVDSFTVIAIPQITAGQTISLPNPSNTTPGRIISIINTGNTWFNINGLKLAPGYSQSVIWNGTTWVLNGDGAGVGVNFIPYVYNEFNNYMGLGMSSLSANTAQGTTSYGDSSLTLNTTGAANTAVGFAALKVSTGNNNTAVGYKSLYSNTTGVANTGLGNQTLSLNTTGFRNTAVGNRALAANLSGSNNNATGFNTLSANTTGSANNAYGSQALFGNTTGSENVAIGNQVLTANTSGSNNIGMGNNALGLNIAGNNNIAIGNQTLYNNGIGSKNIALGDSVLLQNNADRNIAIGHQSLIANTSGTYNIAIGDSALGANTTASGNTALGKFAGRNNTTGTGNVFIGNNAGYTDGTVSTVATVKHATAIGNNAQVTTDSSMVLGGTGANAVRIGVGTTAPNVSALLDLSSTSKGFLMPRLTTTERDGIITPATGLQIYNTTTGTVNIYDGTAWTKQMSGIKSTVNVTFGDTTIVGGPTAATAPSLTFSSNVLGGPGGWNGNTKFSYNNAGFYISHNGSSGPPAAPPGFGLGTGGRQNDLFIGATGNIGIHLPYGASPSATFQNGGSTLFTTLPVANLATGGVIGTAGTTVDSFTVFAVNQTTAGQTLSLPAPTDVTAGRVISVMNTGSAFFTMNTGTIYPGASQSVIWNGTAWALNGDGGGGITGGGTINYLPRFTTGSVVANSTIQDNGSLISTTSPNGILATGNFGTGAIGNGVSPAISGGGTRMMWIPSKGSFRAGTVSTSQWDSASIGNYSAAFGYNNTASGAYATALGNGNIVSGSTANALGQTNTVAGNNSIALGFSNYITGNKSTAIGNNTAVAGDFATAIGFNVSAAQTGSMILGDSSSTTMQTDTKNQMVTRFAGGYKIFTSAGTGLQIAPGGYMRYNANYGSLMDARSLVDKGYVDSIKSTIPAGAGGSFTGSGTANYLTKFTGTTAVGNSVLMDNGSMISMNAANGFLATGTYASGSIPVTGAGSRMMWYPGKAAFRAGNVSSSYWDDTNIGAYSIALGQDVMASGTSSVSFGSNNTSTGQYSTTFGYNNNATTSYSTAFGRNNGASGTYSTVFGLGNTSSGTYSTAFGQGTTASGTHSMALGQSTTASGAYSIAAGTNTVANGSNTVVIGNLLNTNGYAGSMLLGDASGSWTYSDANNQMRMRFVGGYKFNTNAAATMGIQLMGSTGVLKYMGNYALNYDARSLVDKNYVDSVKATMTSGAGGVGTLNFVPKFSAGGMINSSIKDTTWVGISAANGILATGTYGSNGIPAIAGAGTRMMWMPSRGAFRAGNVSSSYWDSTNIGAYSIALGQDVMASGTSSVSFGSNNTSTGQYSTTFGYNNNATTSYTTAFGQGNTASAQYSTAFGRNNGASGTYSTVFGLGNTSSGTYSTAFGQGTTASGTHSMALGQSTTASGAYSIAAGTNTVANGSNTVVIGNLLNTNGYAGSMLLGDASGSWTYSDANNQMRMRFVGGYKFNTDAAATMGIQLMGSTGVLKYMGNYALNYDARSLVDKNYVDSVKATMTSGAGGVGVLNYLSKFSGAGLVNSSIKDSLWVSTNAANGILATGTYALGGVPAIAGAGVRMMWMPSRGAFRAGNVSGSYWDSTNIGAYSIALGQDVMASGTSSVSFGSNNTSTGQYSTTFGYNNNATTSYTTAFGQGNTASAQYSTAFGRNNGASGTYSTVFGLGNTSSGTYSTAFGQGTTASGTHSMALGQSTTASGAYSIAAGTNTVANGSNTVVIGNLLNTNGYAGSMLLGDASGSWTYSDANNQMRMRFVGGYKFNTNAAATMGIQLMGSTGVLKYMGNYALNYDARSLVDKNYVDSVKATMTSGAGGVGTTNFHSKFSATGLVNSLIQDNGVLISTSAQNGILATGTYGTGAIGTGSAPAITGAGTRMMWMPSRGAFRAGNVSSSYWDSTNIGAYSIALGQDVMASGTSSVSFGSNNTSTGQYSTTFGYNNNATTSYTTAFGQGNTASAQYSTAFGRNNGASGTYSTVFGLGNTSSGTYSTAFGQGTTASGTHSMALGQSTTASGAYSIAAGTNTVANGSNTVVIGNLLNTNGYAGSMLLGDASGSWTYSDANNQMRMRFVGGYKFNTNAAATMGIQLMGSTGVLKYMGNYALNYDARSLVDKNYVDSVKATMTSGAGGVGTLNFVPKFSAGGMINSSIKDTTWVGISAANGILATGTYGSNGIPAIAGAGTRMMWMPSRGAFRAGNVSSSYWDSTNIGAYSIALGQDVMASGTSSVSFGSNNTSTGQYSTTFGYNNNATTSYSTAFGRNNGASGTYSTVFGLGNTSSGTYSTAFGQGTTASGTHSMALGQSTTASGAYSIAAGTNTVANGSNTVVIGNLLNTNGYAGSMLLGDASGSWTYSDANNQMRMRFVGGYKFNTDAAATMGIQLMGSTGVLKYMGNYALNYDARSLVDKNYVDSVKATMTSGAGGVGTLNFVPKFSAGGMINSSIKDTTWVGISAANGILATGTYGSNGIPAIAGAGTRMMWMPSRGAFRAGNVSSSYWDSTNIGAYSIALGQDVMASGTSSVSFGSNNTSTGQYSTTFGYNNNATTSYTTAFGQGNTASAQYSTAFGRNNGASGTYSTVFGLGNTSSGTYSTAFGQGTTASGTHSMALGQSTTASGAYSIAAGTNTVANGSNTVVIGNLLNTNGYAGSMLLGDASGSWTYSDANNQMRMRFVGGYKFNTDAAATMGIQLMGSTGVLKYMGNYALNYDARSLVDKNYVDSVKATMTSGAGGVGTTNFHSKFSATGLVNSLIQDNGVLISTSAQNGILATGTFGTGAIGTGSAPATSGAGTRMMWMPFRAAFRAGYVTSNQWDSTNIGAYSIAMGYDVRATNSYSTAFGMSTLASGAYATAFGQSNVASGNTATAFGNSNTASGSSSIAFGTSAIASGNFSLAAGYQITASGIGSTAMGSNVSTNGRTGAFIIGDGNGTVANSDVNHQMKMRFSGGYRLFTDASVTIGVEVAAGGNAWATISDRNKKENFKALDGEAFLNKIAAMPLTSWNYKGQDAKKFRHYGPMAQDFFAAFGKDGIGTVGNDTTINQADLQGVSLVAIQALEKRSSGLKKEVDQVKSENTQIKSENELLKKQNEQLLNSLNAIQEKLDKQMKELVEKIKVIETKGNK